MIEKATIGEIIGSYVKYKWMEDAKENWMAIQNSRDLLVPVDYSYDNVLYQNRYFSDVSLEYQECSFCIEDNNGQPIAIFPLCIYQRDKTDVYHISSWGTYLLEPIIVSSLGEKRKRKLYNTCIDIVKKLGAAFNVESVMIQTIMIESGVSLFQKMIMEQGGGVDKVTFQCLLDLERSESEVFMDLRSTYRRYIRLAEQRWKSKIIDYTESVDVIHETMEKFRDLHIKVAQRETRSIKTWELQEKAVISGDSIVVLLYDNEELIGASLHSSTATMGYYGVGAFKRELYCEPVSHLSQWRAIQYFIRKHVKWYDIGWRCYPGDKEKPSEKELSIGYFKEGFASNEIVHLFTQYVL